MILPILIPSFCNPAVSALVEPYLRSRGKIVLWRVWSEDTDEMMTCIKDEETIFDETVFRIRG